MDFTRNNIITNEDKKTQAILVVGVGATGSHIVVELVKLGFTNITIFDNGIIKEHNCTNQVYPIGAVGQSKQETLVKLIKVRYGVDIYNLTVAPTSAKEYAFVFNCVDSAESRSYYRDKLVPSKLFIETAFDVYSSDLFMMNDIGLLNSIPTGEGNTSEVVSACGSRLTVSASINAFIGSVIWAFIHYINGELEDQFINSRVTIAHFNPINISKITKEVDVDDFFNCEF